MDRLHLMSVFVAVAEAESFAGAARRLGMSPPAVTRAVAALEARLRVRLLDRTTRYVRVTQAGQRYLDDARRIIGEVDEADEAAAGIHADPRGHLAVTAPVLFGTMFVTPGILEYLRLYPGTDVSALFLDRIVNLFEEGLDVGVRIGELPDSSMKAIGVGHVRRVVCASPAYLKEHGMPKTPADLAHHAVILSTSVTPVVEWKFAHGTKATMVRVRPRLTVTSNEAAIEAARRGFGLTRLMSYQIAPYLASGELRAVLSKHEPQRVPINILHREGRYASAKVRTFVDLMVARLRSDKALNWGRPPLR
jgi:DNA-binding transcriptional LysR family regulator